LKGLGYIIQANFSAETFSSEGRRAYLPLTWLENEVLCPIR